MPSYELRPAITPSFSVGYSTFWTPQFGNDGRGDFVLLTSPSAPSVHIRVQFLPGRYFNDYLRTYSKHQQHLPSFHSLGLTFSTQTHEAQFTYTYTAPSGPRQALTLIQETPHGLTQLDYTTPPETFDQYRKEALIIFQSLSLDEG